MATFGSPVLTPAAALYLAILLLTTPSAARKAGEPATSPVARAGWWPQFAATQARELKRADEKASPFHSCA